MAQVLEVFVTDFKGAIELNKINLQYIRHILGRLCHRKNTNAPQISLPSSYRSAQECLPCESTRFYSQHLPLKKEKIFPGLIPKTVYTSYSNKVKLPGKEGSADALSD